MKKIKFINMKRLIYLILTTAPLIIVLIVLNNESTSSMGNNTGVDIKVYNSTGNGEQVPVENAFVKVIGANNNYCETCYTSYSGKCRKQIIEEGYYSFCATKDNYGDGKTVYVSGGTMEVYLLIDNYASCTPCEYPQGNER